MKELNKEESEQYLKVVTKGNMDDMFDFAFNLGWKKAMEKMVSEAKIFYNQLNNKK